MEISARRRSHNGCAQCRRRKVKCDEAADGCRNCARLGFRCSFAASRGISTEGIDSGISRKRVRQACKECRAQKLRCSADIPECERCRWKGIECRYELRRSMPRDAATAVVTAAEENAPPTANPSVHPLRGESSPTDPIQGLSAAGVHLPLELPSSIDLSRSIIQLHLDAFFQYVYSVAPFDFIHRGSLMRAWHRGTMSRSLICAVAGVASRFMDLDPRPLDGASAPCLGWCDEAEKEIICDMGLISIPKLQILLLLIFDRVASGKVTSAWYLAAHASRIIYGLQLNYPTDAVLFTNQECRRRLAWCAYCMDKILTSSGLGYPPLCPRDSMKVLLPCNSRAFDLELECTTCSLDEISGSALTPRQQPSLGSTAYLIWIIDLQDQVKTYLSNWRHSTDNLKPWNSGSHFWKLCQQLIDFSSSLPADTQDNERSIYIRGATPQVNSYVMIQSRLHTCFCELFGTFWISNKKCTNKNWDLSTGPIPAEPVNSAPKRFVDTCRSISVKHAKILNGFWSRVHVVQKYSRRFFVTDWGIAASVYVNSETVILGWDDDPALFDHETGAIEQALTTNLEILYSLAEVSPYVAAWRNRMLHLIAASAHKHILENRLERVKLAEKPPILKLDVEHVLREARRVEDARFPRIKHPTEEQPTQTESPRDEAPVVHSTAMDNDANRDTQQLVASAWPPSLGHADLLSGLKATGTIGRIPQLQSLVGSVSSGSSHNQNTAGVMAPDFATPVASSVDWDQINYLASYTGERDHFGFFAEGLYGEDNTARFIEQGIHGSESYIQSWTSNQ